MTDLTGTAPRSLTPATTDLATAIDTGWARVRATPGYLTEREARFLMAAIALAPASGANVEIGSFKGRSTVGLAYIARQFALGPVTAIDPHTCPSPTDPTLVEQDTTFDDFLGSLAAAGVDDAVRPVRAYSQDAAGSWTQPIRFLWIDGDHSYEGARSDVRLFTPFLVDGAIIAMHDVLGTWEGPLRVFDEEILRRPDFGAAGFCGSIAWAQCRRRDRPLLRHRLQHAVLGAAVRRLIPVAARGRREFGVQKLIRLHGQDKWRYKFWRTLLPHGRITPARLGRRIGAVTSEPALMRPARRPG